MPSFRLTSIRAAAAIGVTCLLAVSQAAAQLRAMVAQETNEGMSRLQFAQASELANALGAATGQKVIVDRTTDFANALRSTRTGEYDMYIVPAHVAASAVNHGFTPLAATSDTDHFVFISKSSVAAATDLNGRLVYLPQQDSLHSYMAKGLLNEAGGSLSSTKAEYRRIPEAGLYALQLGTHDGTVALKSQFEAWRAKEKVSVKVIAESRPIPIGSVLLVKEALGAPLAIKLRAWAVKGGSATVGLGALKPVEDRSVYKYLGELSNFTPTQLAGVARVDASQVQRLLREGAQLIDVRSEKEYKAKRIPGAIFVPYIEKSLKETNFNVALDDFSALGRIDKEKPSIFACNGAECWKSYKASNAAVATGFKKVYWFRGGLPEWEAANLAVEKVQQ